MSFPEALSINAWCGEPVTGELADTAKNWGVRNQRLLLEEFLAADDPAPLRDWENDHVGWGIVLPHKEDLSPAELATANDAPEAIQ